MNFEVFKTLEQLNKRLEQIKSFGVTELITSFNHSIYTLKWR